MEHKFLDRFLNAIRVLLLLISIAALLVAALWQFNGEVVDRISKGIVDTYVGHYREGLNRAAKAAETGDPAQLNSFISSISEIKKGDRLDPIKRAAFKKIINIYQEQNDLETALQWSEEWKQFDGRDFQASLVNAQLLLSAEESYAQGLQELADLNRKLPYVQAVSDVYLGELLEAQKYPEAYLVIDRDSEKYLGGAKTWQNKPWQVYWDTGSSFNTEQMLGIRPRFSDTGELVLEFEAEANVRRLRIDPPEKFELLINAAQISTTDSHPNLVQKLADLPMTLHHIERQSNTLKTDGRRDPYFFWRLPKQMISPQRQTWVFKARVNERFPEKFAPLFERDVAVKIVEALNLAGNQAALQRYLSLFKLSNNLETDADVEAVFSQAQSATGEFRDEYHNNLKAQIANNGGVVENAG